MAYEEFPCDICGENTAIEAPHTADYTNGEPLSICAKCGFVYVKHRRTAKEIADWWSEKLYGSHYIPRIPAVVARQTYVSEFIHSELNVTGKHVIDIGAGNGQFLDMLLQHGATVFGIEPSESNCKEMSSRGLPNFCGTIEDFMRSPHAQMKADIVTIIWTLENCMSCKDMLDAAYQLVKENGSVVVATGSRILVPFKKTLQEYIGPDEPQDIHPFRFSARSLKAALAKSHLEVTHQNRYFDSDILCEIAQPAPQDKHITTEHDDPKAVADFFERWHKESLYYRNSQ